MSKRLFLIAPVVFTIFVIGADLCMPVLFSLLRRFAHTKMAEGAAQAYSSGSLSLMYVMVPNMEVAKALARPLVEKKQAACINIVPGVTSLYEWEGKVEEDSELIMLVKTSTSRVDEITKFLRENHPYDIPAIVSLKIDNGHPPFLQWISDTVEEKSQSDKDGQ